MKKILECLLTNYSQQANIIRGRAQFAKHDYIVRQVQEDVKHI